MPTITRAIKAAGAVAMVAVAMAKGKTTPQKSDCQKKAMDFPTNSPDAILLSALQTDLADDPQALQDVKRWSKKNKPLDTTSHCLNQVLSSCMPQDSSRLDPKACLGTIKVCLLQKCSDSKNDTTTYLVEKLGKATQTLNVATTRLQNQLNAKNAAKIENAWIEVE